MIRIDDYFSYYKIQSFAPGKVYLRGCELIRPFVNNKFPCGEQFQFIIVDYINNFIFLSRKDEFFLLTCKYEFESATCEKINYEFMDNSFVRNDYEKDIPCLSIGKDIIRNLQEVIINLEITQGNSYD